MNFPNHLFKGPVRETELDSFTKISWLLLMSCEEEFNSLAEGPYYTAKSQDHIMKESTKRNHLKKKKNILLLKEVGKRNHW